MPRPGTRDHMLAITKRRIGLDGYAKFYASMRGKPPMTTAELAQASGLSHRALLEVLRHLLRCKLVHRAEWVRPAPNSRMVPKWVFGDGPDVSMPMYEEAFRSRAKLARRAPSILFTMTTALELLADGPCSHPELAAEMGMSVSSAERIVAVLRRHRLVYIASWIKPPAGRTIAEYGVGDCKAAPRPKRIDSSANVKRRYKHRDLLHLMAAPLPQEEPCTA